MKFQTKEREKIEWQNHYKAKIKKTIFVLFFLLLLFVCVCVRFTKRVLAFDVAIDLRFAHATKQKPNI